MRGAQPAPSGLVTIAQAAMPIAPLVQTSAVDVSTWKLDEDFGIYPEGKRAKEARFAPDEPPEPILRPGHRYLFKRSRKAYAEQFWAEVIAYRIGCLLGCPVPPAFASWNSATGICGALIEWFFIDGQQVSVLGGDFLQKTQTDFDRRRGTTHNLHDNERLMRALIQGGLIQREWRSWWAGALLFDALIGNTDRHQDNWSVVINVAAGQFNEGRLSPYFDNGTSLGFELEVPRASDWDEDRLDRYIAKGMHHIRWRTPGSHDMERVPHVEALRRVIAQWPQTADDMRRLIMPVTASRIEECLQGLVGLEVPVPLTSGRLALTVRLLARRLQLIQAAIA